MDNFLFVFLFVNWLGGNDVECWFMNIWIHNDEPDNHDHRHADGCWGLGFTSNLGMVLPSLLTVNYGAQSNA